MITRSIRHGLDIFLTNENNGYLYSLKTHFKRSFLLHYSIYNIYNGEEDSVLSIMQKTVVKPNDLDTILTNSFYMPKKISNLLNKLYIASNRKWNKFQNIAMDFIHELTTNSGDIKNNINIEMNLLACQPLGQHIKFSNIVGIPQIAIIEKNTPFPNYIAKIIALYGFQVYNSSQSDAEDNESMRIYNAKVKAKSKTKAGRKALLEIQRYANQRNIYLQALTDTTELYWEIINMGADGVAIKMDNKMKEQTLESFIKAKNIGVAFQNAIYDAEKISYEAAEKYEHLVNRKKKTHYKKF
jgi:hypothetical protein